MKHLKTEILSTCNTHKNAISFVYYHPSLICWLIITIFLPYNTLVRCCSLWAKAGTEILSLIFFRFISEFNYDVIYGIHFACTHIHKAEAAFVMGCKPSTLCSFLTLCHTHIYFTTHCVLTHKWEHFTIYKYFWAITTKMGEENRKKNLKFIHF